MQRRWRDAALSRGNAWRTHFGESISCFEPDPRAQAAFRENVKNPRVELFEIAIGDVDGTIEFYPSGGTPPDPSREVRSGGWDLSGSIRKPRNHLKVHPWCTFEDAIQVPARKLDTWAREQRVKKIDFIWADVQGAEIDLVRGGRETLRNTRYLYTEYNNNEMYEGQVNLRTLLKELPDFEVVTAYRDDVLLRNRRFNS